MLKRTSFIFTSALIASATSSALAQEPTAPPPVPTSDAGGPAAKSKLVIGPDTAKRPEGWTPGLAIGATFNLTDNRNVVGQQDGTSVTLGIALDASLEFNKGIHEWRNGLKASAGATRAPALGEFVKTNDGLSFETIYLLHAIEEFGPFARVAFNTQMFPSLDIRPAGIDYAITPLGGGEATDITGRRLYLTDAFTPFTLKESLGVFTQPLNSDRIKLEARAGLGAQQIFAEGQLAIDDDTATPVVEVKTLNDSTQLGAELVANAWGAFDDDKRVSYTIGVGVLVPFVVTGTPADDDRSAPEFTSVEVNGGLNVKLLDWASLDYKLAVLRQPALVDAVQVTNSLLLTIGAAWGSKAPKEEPKCVECEPGPPAPAPEAAPTPPPAEPAPAPTPPPAEPAPAPAPAPAPDPAPAPAPAPNP